MSNKILSYKNSKELIIEDILDAYEAGICFVCGDGGFKHFSFDSKRRLKNVG
jgi:hypothetical protein